MNELALFAGAGGGILGGKLLGWRTVCAVEYDSYAASVLIQRQNDGILQPFPIWDDVRTFQGESWRGVVDVVSGGFPCQDISSAGSKQGIQGERSGLWSEMARIICEVQPRHVFVENSPDLTFRGLGHVLGDLAEMGYDARWGVLGFNHVGAGHVRRKRIWIVAESNLYGLKCLPYDGIKNKSDLGDDNKFKDEDVGFLFGLTWQRKGARYSKETASQSLFCGEAYGVARGVDRIKRIGDGQIPIVAAEAWRLLKFASGK
jgi:DNA (cytosine-5)-methyltransferase 1